jgi:hypothetical protein
MTDLREIKSLQDEIVLLEKPELTPDMCRSLIDFYKSYQQRNLLFFLKLRYEWHKINREKTFPGLCADINPITGEFRPPNEQRGWSWGDGRGLGIWINFLINRIIPDKKIGITFKSGRIKSVNLKEEYLQYCDLIYENLLQRYHANHGFIPFTVDINTNKALLEPPAIKLSKEEMGFSTLFAVNGFFQYGLYNISYPTIEFAMEILERAVNSIESGVFKSDYRETRKGVRSHGSRMILIGTVVDIIKSINTLEQKGTKKFSHYKEILIEKALPFIDYILDNHYQKNPPAFWENNDEQGRRLEENGTILVDPGHATECAGFLAEIVPFLPDSSKNIKAKWKSENVLKAALDIHLFADSIGWSPRGVMFKAVDLKTGKPLPDSMDSEGNMIPTAPWWNVREHCAAALRLFTLTGDKRCLETYRKAQNASYIYYPNHRIDGMMFQTVDPYTLKPLDIPPATGNLDPMHDPRARQREIENLEIILQNS